MQGEALFNDGVGIVLFTLLVGIIQGGGHADPSAWHIAEVLGREAGGGLLLGLVTGYLGYRAMRSVDEYPVEVLITLAVVAGSYAIAQRLGASGPLAMVSAGLLIGDRAPRDAMSERTKGYISALWTLIDEVLNSVLFLLIGIEVLLLHLDLGTLLLAATAIPIVLVARLVAVTIPLLLFGWRAGMSLRNVPFLTWAGVRGGISVALALALPDGPAKPAVLVATYGVVLFSIVVQGSTLAALARRMVLAQITGSIISTSLLGLGLAIVVGGLSRERQTHPPSVARRSGLRPGRRHPVRSAPPRRSRRAGRPADGRLSGSGLAGGRRDPSADPCSLGPVLGAARPAATPGAAHRRALARG